MWQALKMCCEADAETGKMILESAGLTKLVRMGKQQLMCYDELGFMYELPLYVLRKPDNLITEVPSLSPGPEQQDGKQLSLSPSSSSTATTVIAAASNRPATVTVTVAAVGSASADKAKDLGPPVKFKLRLGCNNPQTLVLTMGSNQTALSVKQHIVSEWEAKRLDFAPYPSVSVKRMRLFLLGRHLPDNVKLAVCW